MVGGGLPAWGVADWGGDGGDELCRDADFCLHPELWEIQLPRRSPASRAGHNLAGWNLE